MNTNIETEYTSTEVLENNLQQIEELVQEKGMVALPFTEDMQKTQEINEVFLSVGFLKEDMHLNSFYLVARIDEKDTFEFGLCYGVGGMEKDTKKISCSLVYRKNKEYGITTMRTLQEEGKSPKDYTHSLFKDGLDKLSKIDKKIFGTLVLTFLRKN